MLVSGLVLALYFWAFFIGVDNVGSALLVGDIAAVVAGVAFLSAAVSYLWAPRRAIVGTSWLLFLILVAMVALLLFDTGLTTSPFIALWMLLAVFAPVLGTYGAAVIAVGIAGFLAHEYLNNTFDIDDIAVAALAGLLPLVIGYMIWPARVGEGKSETREDRSYHELAHELSTVSGQSEIVIAAIADGVVSINHKGEIQLINPAAQKMIGWDKSDALGLNYKSVLKLVDNHDQPPSDVCDPIQKALATNQETSADTLSIVTADSGKKFLASITASPTGSMGSGLIIVFRDVTKERAEERERAEFISTASHEMRTPVASIEGYLGLALNPATATIDERAREFIGKAQESAQHLGRLFQDLLDVSKADDGRLSNNPGVVDLVAFVHGIVQGQLPRAVDKGLRLHYKPMPDDATADRYAASSRVMNPVFYTKVDNNHLREVIENLLENAIKYTPQGSIEVDISGDDTSVTLTIKDSGIGIPQEDIQHLFQKFYRVDNSDTREIGGTGLGLYLCRRLVETIGGKIWVESTYQSGSTFYVKLPRLDAVTARREIEAAGEVEAVDDTASSEAASAPEPPTPTPQAAAPAPQPPKAIPTPTVPAPSKATSPPPVTRTTPTAPVFVPRSRQNTPLTAIERSPGRYVQSQPQETKH